MPDCRYCGKSCKDWGELALHVQSQKKGHRGGKKWAAQYLLKTRQLNSKKELNGRQPMSEEAKEIRRELIESVRLSGEEVCVETLCPNPKCKRVSKQVLPVEYVRSPNAWRTENQIIKLCRNCER